MTQNRKRRTPSDDQARSNLNIGKVPPNAADIEEVLLGACMIQWQEARFEVMGKLEAKDFYRIEHQHIFSAIETLDRYGKSVDILSVTKILKKEGTLDLVGGPHFVAALTDRVAGAGNVEFWVMLIKQEFMKREMIRITGELYNRASCSARN